VERAYRIRPRTSIDFALVLGASDIAKALRICRGPIGRGSGGNATRAGPSVVAPGRWKNGLAAFNLPGKRLLLTPVSSARLPRSLLSVRGASAGMPAVIATPRNRCRL
jgi:hypothetical protein